MELILIRHAKAEDRAKGLVDIDRHLTDKGKKKFNKLMPELKERLMPLEDRTVVTWSSPANRAVETAEITVSELGLEEPSIHEFIYTGEFEKFLKELETVQDDATLLVFGHEPTLSEWVEQFTGESVRMRKGSMVSMEVTEKSPLTAEFMWQIKR